VYLGVAAGGSRCRCRRPWPRLVASPLRVTGVAGNGTKQDGREGVVLLLSSTAPQSHTHLIGSRSRRPCAALPIPVPSSLSNRNRNRGGSKERNTTNRGVQIRNATLSSYLLTSEKKVILIDYTSVRVIRFSQVR
jgi:hypothetical protein